MAEAVCLEPRLGRIFMGRFSCAAFIPFLVVIFLSEGSVAQTSPADTPGPFEQSGDACSLQSLPVPINPPGGCKGLVYTLGMVEAPHGHYAGTPDPTCINDVGVGLPEATSAVISYYTGNVAGAAGSLTKAIQKAQDSFRPILGNGTIANILFGKQTKAASCMPVGIYIPKEGQIIGVRLESFDREGGFHKGAIGWHPCSPDRNDCNIGWSRFDPKLPLATTKGGLQFISSTFMNWSDNRTRWARIIAVYRLPAGMSIPKPL